MKPLIIISGSEPSLIKDKLKDISVIDNTQIYPDYKIVSQHGYSIGVARATTNDLVSNKMSIASHVAEELEAVKCDLKIFLMEDWLGMDHNKKVSLPGGIHRNWNYMAVINNVMVACIANNALWIPSASISATIEMLRIWNNETFQKERYSSLNIRPRKADKVFSLTTDSDERRYEDKIWWLSDLPGINLGRKRSEALLESSNGTLLAAFIKTRKELKEVSGFGPTIANNFRLFLDT